MKNILFALKENGRKIKLLTPETWLCVDCPGDSTGVKSILKEEMTTQSSCWSLERSTWSHLYRELCVGTELAPRKATKCGPGADGQIKYLNIMLKEASEWLSQLS